MRQSFKNLARTAAIVLAAGVVSGVTRTAEAQSNKAFTYQGVVTSNGVVPSSIFVKYDLFRIETGGNSIGQIFEFVNPEDNGQFASELDFGETGNDGLPIYNGGDLYLEINIDNIALAPRQRITPAPIALSMPGVYASGTEFRIGEGFDTIRFGDTTSLTSISIPNGGLCVDTDGQCTPVAGGIRVGIGGLLGTNQTGNHVLINPAGEGFVGIGTATPTERLDVAGAIRIRGADIVEGFDSSSGEIIEAGTVVSIDPTPGQEGRLRPSSEAYDSKVAGVVSGAGGLPYGMSLAYDGQFGGDTKVAMTGRVYVKCSAEGGPIRPGDLLTTAALDGHAMKASDRDRAHGTVIGKAMSTLGGETGLVLVLVNLQ